MYSNNRLNFPESTTILNACTKKSGNLLNVPRNSMTGVWTRLQRRHCPTVSHFAKETSSLFLRVCIYVYVCTRGEELYFRNSCVYVLSLSLSLFLSFFPHFSFSLICVLVPITVCGRICVRTCARVCLCVCLWKKRNLRLRWSGFFFFCIISDWNKNRITLHMSQIYVMINTNLIRL